LPVAAFAVWLLVVRGTYASIEKIFLTASVTSTSTYIIAGLIAHPTGRRPAHHGDAARSGGDPGTTATHLHGDRDLVGTTDRAVDAVLPTQASIVEKGITARQ
jgi:hypothetical protein